MGGNYRLSNTITPQELVDQIKSGQIKVKKYSEHIYDKASALAILEPVVAFGAEIHQEKAFMEKLEASYKKGDALMVSFGKHTTIVEPKALVNIGTVPYLFCKVDRGKDTGVCNTFLNMQALSFFDFIPGGKVEGILKTILKGGI